MGQARGAAASMSCIQTRVLVIGVTSQKTSNTKTHTQFVQKTARVHLVGLHGTRERISRIRSCWWWARRKSAYAHPNCTSASFAVAVSSLVSCKQALSRGTVGVASRCDRLLDMPDGRRARQSGCQAPPEIRQCQAARTCRCAFREYIFSLTTYFTCGGRDRRLAVDCVRL